MDSKVIRFTLDLLVRLIDTTTGRYVGERNVTFKDGSKNLEAKAKGDGSYIFMNRGREDFSLTVIVAGFETQTVNISYETLDSGLPVKEVFLIPIEETFVGGPVRTLSGTLSKLEKVEAVALYGAAYCISEFDERKRIMTLFQKGSKAGLDDVYYGLIHQGQEDFEPFEVVKTIPPLQIKLKTALQEPFTVNSPIARIVFGSVSPKGEYILRVRDNATKLIYIVRYVVNGEAKYKVVDFHELEGVKLQ